HVVWYAYHVFIGRSCTVVFGIATKFAKKTLGAQTQKSMWQETGENRNLSETIHDAIYSEVYERLVFTDLEAPVLYTPT
ncbi:hypothetical protein ACJX0J_023146, partial [Zea mays]